MSRSVRIAALVAVTLMGALGLNSPNGQAAVPATSSVTTGSQDTAKVVLTVTGRVVRFNNGNPVRNVRVSAYEAVPDGSLGSDLTDRDGRFVIRGVEAEDDELGILVDGRRVGFERGWVTCTKTLVSSWGDACTFSSQVGKVRIKTS